MICSQKSAAYFQHQGRVFSRGGTDRLMALTLNPQNPKEGIARCVTKREGDLQVKGYKDTSVLIKVKSIRGLEKFKVDGPLKIRNSREILSGLKKIRTNLDFVGFEDPDLIFDSGQKLLHLYFTIPFLRRKPGEDNFVCLGHAFGEGLDSLVMTAPVLLPESGGKAKELSLAPVNSSGIRLNLVESKSRTRGVSYSTVRIAAAKNFDPPWRFGRTVIYPQTIGYQWCAGHVSPGPLLPPEFLDAGKNKRIGILNGREANSVIGGQTHYGRFSIGLFLYDFEKGKVDWVSPQPLISDSEARTISFASAFVQTGEKEGILYAHVDDSFIRAYTLFSDGIKEILGKK